MAYRSTFARRAVATVGTCGALGGFLGYLVSSRREPAWTTHERATSASLQAAERRDRPPTLEPRLRLHNHKNVALDEIAQAFGRDLIVSVFRDEETLRDLTTLLIKTFTDPRVTEDLKTFFKEQFTEDEVTVKALKTFLVTDVLGDAWVREVLLAVTSELGQGIADDAAIWPTATLATLGDAGLEALQTPEFQEQATEAVKKALLRWKS